MFRLLDRLASKHFVAILLVTVCFTAFSLSLQAYIYYTQGVEARDQILQSVESSYLAPTAAAVFYFETDQLQLIAEGILRLPYIDSLTIYEYVLKEYRPLLVKNAESRSNESFDFPLVYLYEGEARHIGKLTVHSSLSDVRTQIIENLRRTAVFNIFSVLGMAVIILWLTNRNITKRMKGEETLRQSNERFRIAQDMSPDGFTILQPVRDTQNRVIDFTWVYENDAIARLNGTDPQKVVGQRLLELFPGHRDTQFMKVYQQVAESGEAITFEDGYSGESMQKQAWFRIVVVPMAENIAILAQDITKRKQVEEAIETAHKQLEVKNKELEQFVYSVSHDLRSPLITVKTFTGMLRHHLPGGDPAQINGDLNYIDKAADKLQLLLDALLQYSRIGRFDAPAQTLSASQTVTNCLAALAGILQQHQVQVSTGELTRQLHGDVLHFQRIWQNLIENAVKYRGDQPLPHIEIGARQQGHEVVFYVRDNGMGIAPEHRERIFDLFSQVDQSSEGSGLGLALVKKIVSLYQGRIWVESAGKGQGSCFLFTLPAALTSSEATG